VLELRRYGIPLSCIAQCAVTQGRSYYAPGPLADVRGCLGRGVTVLPRPRRSSEIRNIRRHYFKLPT